jgi:hypothetical protein
VRRVAKRPRGALVGAPHPSPGFYQVAKTVGSPVAIDTASSLANIAGLDSAFVYGGPDAITGGPLVKLPR